MGQRVIAALQKKSDWGQRLLAVGEQRYIKFATGTAVRHRAVS